MNTALTIWLIFMAITAAVMLTACAIICWVGMWSLARDWYVKRQISSRQRERASKAALEGITSRLKGGT